MLWPKKGDIRRKPMFMDVKEALSLINERKEDKHAFL